MVKNMKPEQLTKYSYSINNKDFIGDFDNPEEAASVCFMDSSEIEACYIGKKKQYKSKDFIPIFNILEMIDNCSEDECGDKSYFWLYELLSDEEKKNELKKLIGDWIDKNYPIDFFNVCNVVTYYRSDFLLSNQNVSQN